MVREKARSESIMKELNHLIATFVSFVKRNKFLILAFGGILILILFSRLFQIMSLPLFTDEAIYVRWAQIARYDPNWRFISLTDGKQPSFIWFAMIVMRFVSDPLLASRLVSVGAGLGSAIGLFFLGRELFKNRWVGLVASLLYLVYPMGVVYDRMALYDSLVGMFFIWALYLEVLLVRRVRLDIALLLGMVMGAGMLTKTNAFFSIPLMVFSLALFDFKQKDVVVRLIRWAAYAGIAVFLALGMYSILRLSPFYHIINDKNAIFVFPLNEWIKDPGQYLTSNLRGLFDWLRHYMTIPWLVLVVMAFFRPEKSGRSYVKSVAYYLLPFAAGTLALFVYGSVTHQKDFFYEKLPFVSLLFLAIVMLRAFMTYKDRLGEKLLLIVAFAMPFIYLATFGRTIYPRFIFFMTVPLLILVSYTLVSLRRYLKDTKLYAGFFVLLLLLPVYISHGVITDIARSPIPLSDREQYVNAWPAGGGIHEAIDFLNNQSKRRTIYVASLGDFGSLPKYAVEIYLGDNKNVIRRDPGVYPVPDAIPDDLLKHAAIMPTYVLSSNQNEFDAQTKLWPLRKILEIRKGVGKSYTRLYQVLPQ